MLNSRLAAVSENGSPSVLRGKAHMRVLLLAPIVLVFAVLVLVAAPAKSNGAFLKGLMDEEMSRSDDAGIRAEYWGRVYLSKTNFARTYLQWDGKKSNFDPGGVGSIRRLIDEAVDAGVTTVQLGWNDRLGAKYSDAKKLDLTAWRKHVHATAMQFKDVTKVKLVWSPWNEANYGSLMPRKNGPRTWLKMSNIAYDELKKVNPEWQVIAGELAPYARNTRIATDPGKWWKAALCLNDRYTSSRCSKSSSYLKADAISIHPYDYLRSPNSPRPNKDQWTINNLASTRKFLARTAKAGRISKTAANNLWLTEFGYQTKGSQALNSKKAASWTKQAWNIAKRNKVKSFIWFQLRDPKPPSPFNTGLMTTSGSARPVWNTWKGLN